MTGPVNQAQSRKTSAGLRRSAPWLSVVLPNLLSLGRLSLGLAFPWIPSGWRMAAVLTGAISDLLDGELSRKLHARTSAGRLLDPLADKCLVLGIVATLLWEGQLELWQAALVAVRDIAVVLGASWMIWQGGWSARHQMRPTVLGKLTTVLQFVFLVSLLAFESLRLELFLVTVIFSVLAAVDYVRLLWPDGS